MRLSKSSIGTFRRCPFLFKLQVIDEVPLKIEAEALKKGKEIHELLETIYKPDTRDIKEAVKLVQEHPYFSYYYEIVDKVLVFNAKVNDGKLLQPLMLERKIYDPSIDFVGVVDVVHTQGSDVLILDYKSGKAHYAKEGVHEDYLFELTMYAYLVEYELKIKVTHIGIWFVEHDDKPIIQALDRSLIDKYKKEISEINEDIKIRKQTDNFPKKWNVFCNERCSAFINGFCEGCKK